MASRLRGRNPGHRASRRKPKRSKPFHEGVPTIPGLVESHTDERGALDVIFSETKYKNRAGSVAVITSKKGTERANHQHKKDSHFTYVVSGRVAYYERMALGALRWEFGPGKLFFTPPKVDHTMEFLKDTILVVVGNRGRTEKDYEDDLVRFSPSLVEEFKK